MNITGIGKLQARLEYKFYYISPAEECRKCKYKNVCITLERGKMYRITKIRDAEHECPVHSDGIKVVEVERSEINVLVERKEALIGSVIEYKPYRCNKIECKYWNICNENLIHAENHLKIISIDEFFKCPIGRDLAKVKVE